MRGWLVTQRSFIDHWGKNCVCDFTFRSSFLSTFLKRRACVNMAVAAGSGDWKPTFDSKASVRRQSERTVAVQLPGVEDDGQDGLQGGGRLG